MYFYFYLQLWCHITIFRLVPDYVGGVPGLDLRKKFDPWSFFLILVPPCIFWLIIQSILNRFGWFLAQKIQKNRGNNHPQITCDEHYLFQIKKQPTILQKAIILWNCTRDAIKLELPASTRGFGMGWSDCINNTRLRRQELALRRRLSRTIFLNSAHSSWDGWNLMINQSLLFFDIR